MRAAESSETFLHVSRPRCDNVLELVVSHSFTTLADTCNLLYLLLPIFGRHIIVLLLSLDLSSPSVHNVPMQFSFQRLTSAALLTTVASICLSDRKMPSFIERDIYSQ